MAHMRIRGARSAENDFRSQGFWGSAAMFPGSRPRVSEIWKIGIAISDMESGSLSVNVAT